MVVAALLIVNGWLALDISTLGATTPSPTAADDGVVPNGEFVTEIWSFNQRDLCLLKKARDFR